MTSQESPSRPRSVASAGVVLGIGLGGFVDGIVLHQILQWHHMLSETPRYGGHSVVDLRANVVADGLFHVFAWIAVSVGLWMLFQVGRRGIGAAAGRSLLGWILVGWGVFNLVEGVVNHHILGIHRVRPTAASPLQWDVGFLVLGATLVVAGVLVGRSDRNAAPGSGLESDPSG